MIVDRERLIYAFGHLVASHNPEDAHHGDSGDLADEVLVELGLSQEVRDLLELVAEEVAGNWAYTGKAAEISRQIAAGEV